MDQSTISMVCYGHLWPFLIAKCLFTRGYSLYRAGLLSYGYVWILTGMYIRKILRTWVDVEWGCPHINVNIIGICSGLEVENIWCISVVETTNYVRIQGSFMGRMVIKQWILGTPYFQTRSFNRAITGKDVYTLPWWFSALKHPIFPLHSTNSWNGWAKVAVSEMIGARAICSSRLYL